MMTPAEIAAEIARSQAAENAARARRNEYARLAAARSERTLSPVETDRLREIERLSTDTCGYWIGL